MEVLRIFFIKGDSDYFSDSRNLHYKFLIRLKFFSDFLEQFNSRA